MERDRCWMCGGQLIVGGNFSFEDYGIAGNGMVTNLSCADCGAYVEYHVSFDDEDEDPNPPHSHTANDVQRDVLRPPTGGQQCE